MMYCRLPSSRSEMGDSPSPAGSSDGVSGTSPMVYWNVTVLVMPDDMSVTWTFRVWVPSAGLATCLLLSLVMVSDPSPKSQTNS